MHVTYSGAKGQVVRYGCRGAAINHGAGSCINIGALRLERVITEELLTVLSPLGLEAALEAARRMEDQGSQERAQSELALQQARYEAERARKQYDLADPENRLVADELERRWNEKLCLVEELEGKLQMMTLQIRLSPEDKEELLALGQALCFVWDQAASNVQLKKRILRTSVKEIVISISQGIVTGVVHWEGGDHSEVRFPKSHTGMHRWKTDLETEGLIRGLARIASDHDIASLLNRLGKKTGKGNSWTQGRVTTFRNDHDIAVYEEGEVERRGEMFLDQAAAKLGVHKSKIYKSIRQGLLPATQVCQGAPWILAQETLNKHEYFLGRDEPGSPESPLTSNQVNLFSGKTTT
jgi:excisionase family DNA binding protein